MCGIFGAINTSDVFTHAAFERFAGLTDLVHYRGPDDSGHLALNIKRPEMNSGTFDVFLGNRRLSILDLSANGHQPMTDGKGHWIAYNGEIFNYVELRRDLETKGHRFNTGTDTEVILHVYDEYGEQGFDRLNGMWAFAIVDVPRRRLVLSRDRFSIKPLYLLRTGGCLYFASEIKQLLPLVPARKLNVEVMSAFLTQALLDYSRETFFQGITKAAPRTNIIISLDDGSIIEMPYWNFQEAEPVSSADSIEQFRELFLDSVRLRLRSDVKVGVLLSGGLDSSAIAVACDQVASGQLETYSIVSEDGCCDEHKFIDALCLTGVKNQKIVFRPGDVLQDLDAVLYHSDEPFGGFSVLAQHKLLGAVKQATDVVVLLSGQGGDEVLLGYLKFFFFHLKMLYRERRYWRAFAQLAGSLLQRTVVRQFSLRTATRYLPALDERRCRAFKLERTRVPIWECGNLRARQISDLEHYSVPALTHYEDRNSMAHSLEVRHPFLDHRLVEFLVNLPMDMKLHNGWTKYILRQAIPELPREIRWRRDKQGFLVPEQQWLKRELAPVIRDMFRDSRLAQAGILDEKEFLAYYDRFQDGAAVPYSDISRTLIAERWMQQAF